MGPFFTNPSAALVICKIGPRHFCTHLPQEMNPLRLRCTCFHMMCCFAEIWWGIITQSHTASVRMISTKESVLSPSLISSHTRIVFDGGLGGLDHTHSHIPLKHTHIPLKHTRIPLKHARIPLKHTQTLGHTMLKLSCVPTPLLYLRKTDHGAF